MFTATTNFVPLHLQWMFVDMPTDSHRQLLSGILSRTDACMLGMVVQVKLELVRMQVAISQRISGGTWKMLVMVHIS